MHPILFKIPLPHWKFPWVGQLNSFPIYSYGVMLGLSLIVGWYLSLWLAKKDGLPREAMANNYVFTAIVAVVGARLLYVAVNPSEFHSFKDVVSIRSGGLVAYGGFLGGFLGSWLYCKRKGVRLLAWADAAVPSLATGLVLTRIGCYLFGCDYGRKLSEKAPSFLKKLGTFPEWHYDPSAGKWLTSEQYGQLDNAYRTHVLSGSPAWLNHANAGLPVLDTHHSLPVHPTQIYESIIGLCLLGLLYWVRKDIKTREAEKKPFFRGELFLVFTFSYAVLRFLLEMVRDDSERGYFGPYVEPHIVYPVALMLIALSFVFGLSHMFQESKRILARSVALLLPLALFLLLKPANKFELVERVRMSTSQWIAIFTGIAASLYYRRAALHAELDPASATDLGPGVPGLLAAEAEDEASARQPSHSPQQKES